MANKIFKQLTSLSGTTNKVPTHEISFNKLYFINLLNTCGGGNKPKIFGDYITAAKSCPSLAKICEDLRPEQIKNLIERIENIL